MVTDEFVNEYIKTHYTNGKTVPSQNIHMLVWKHFQKHCIDLSIKCKRNISASARTEFIMVRDMLEQGTLGQ